MDHQSRKAVGSGLSKLPDRNNSAAMHLWNAHLLIGSEPQRDLCFEIFLKLNSAILRTPTGSLLLGAPLSEKEVGRCGRDCPVRSALRQRWQMTWGNQA